MASRMYSHAVFTAVA